jgi:enterochelin esterase-like enzyme
MERHKKQTDQIARSIETSWALQSFEGIHSLELNRDVTIDVFLPPGYAYGQDMLPVLMLNDGQDSDNMGLLEILNVLSDEQSVVPFIVIGIYCGERIQEYGVSSRVDYKKRGSRAKAYSAFVTEHLFPFLESRFRVKSTSRGNAIAGYSLGGLSAMDIAWNNPDIFQLAGAFSGAFWWRKRDLDIRYTEADRIMHAEIRQGKFKPGMKFWFQAGTQDETADRNGNGIIDAIDDTLDVISELIIKGYKPYYDVVYHEVKNGRHDVPTWGKAMPYFLRWAFGKK